MGDYRPYFHIHDVDYNYYVNLHDSFNAFNPPVIFGVCNPLFIRVKHKKYFRNLNFFQM